MKIRYALHQLLNLFINESYTYRVIPDHPVYGSNMREVKLNGPTIALVNVITNQVFEVTVTTVEHGDVFWVDPQFEVAMHSRTPPGEQSFCIDSILQIALSVATNQEYDPGLLNDIEIQLDGDMIAIIDDLARARNEPRAKLMVDWLSEALTSITNEDFIKGIKTQ